MSHREPQTVFYDTRHGVGDVAVHVEPYLNHIGQSSSHITTCSNPIIEPFIPIGHPSTRVDHHFIRPNNMSASPVRLLDASAGPEVSQRSALNQVKKPKLTILLIGETGSGKTAFMSLLINLFKGNKHMQLVDYNDQSNESGLAVTESQTNTAKLYTVITPDRTEIRVLDTPGLADTRGIEQDKMHKASIRNAIQEFIPAIDAVMIIANGTAERLDAATNYTLSVISAMFPRSIINNIGFIFTNCDSLTLNFNQEGLQPELRNSERWLIQNPLALIKNYRNQENMLQDRQKVWMERKIKDQYDETVETLNVWLAWLDHREVQPTTEIHRLYDICNVIESNLEAAISNLAELTKQRDTYQRIEADLLRDVDAHVQNIALMALSEEQNKPIWSRESTSEPNTICLYPGCYHNCHAPCKTKITGDPKSLGRWCRQFKSLRYIPSMWSAASAKCKNCNHEARHHGHYLTKHVQKPQANLEAIEQLQASLDQNQRLWVAKEVARKALENINAKMANAQYIIRSSVNEFNSLAISRNFAGHIISAIDILKLRKQELKSNPRAKEEVALIDMGIDMFEQKLSILGQGSSGLNLPKAVARSVAHSASNFFSWYPQE